MTQMVPFAAELTFHIIRTFFRAENKSSAPTWSRDNDDDDDDDDDNDDDDNENENVQDAEDFLSHLYDSIRKKIVINRTKLV